MDDDDTSHSNAVLLAALKRDRILMNARPIRQKGAHRNRNLAHEIVTQSVIVFNSDTKLLECCAGDRSEV